jgi:hypothetical protein
MLRLNDSGYNLTSFVRQNITGSARYLTDNSMGAKHSEPMGNTGRQTPPGIDIVAAGIELLQNILVSKTSYIELPSADYLKKMCRLGSKKGSWIFHSLFSSPIPIFSMCLAAAASCEGVLRPNQSRFSAAKIYFPDVPAISFSAIFWLRDNAS